MNSGSWGSGTPAGELGGTPSGDEVTSGRGSAGESSFGPTGSARIVIGFVFLWLTLLCVWLAFTVTHQRDGVLILATIFGAVTFWAVGAYRKQFWS